MITHDTLLRVRETARIDEVAAGYLTLRRSGKDLVALCPFHDERHPSFRISPALNIGKCFSCGEAADPIRLVRHMEGCGFEEAVRLLARKYGIEVEEERGTEEAGRHEARQAILRGNEAFARSLLPYDPAEGITGEDENGEEDLRALRETFSHFGVGICPPDAPEGDVLLCEGYKDVIAFHAAGIRHAAGLCGTALTEDHVRMIRRLTGHVTLALDPDPAGQAATLRSARLLLARGCEVGLLPLPGGMDPDEVFRRQGAEALRRLVRTEAVDYLSHRIREAAGRKGGPDAGGIRDVLGEIRLVGSPLAVYRRMEELSKATGIPLDVLREELSASPGEPVRTGPAEVATGLPPARLRERALLRFCLANHDRMFYAGDGSGISLPAWVASELSAGGMPLTEPAHLDLLALLSGGGHPDGITDESLSAPHPLPPFLLPGGGTAGKAPRRTFARRGRTPALPLRRAFHTRPATTHGRTPPLRYLDR
ncbi:CHC2 zinc finger domain-containing protein [Parabacteroides distasonis]|uniref:CHC2 zinc finger domain-containing protein n=1 Tax=Parabacteroides distasonis TaxID=823 RepID=UPI002166886A|nr:CHC2 zinc finger domain-containing protein [Parabacteroides distasonis]MCS3338203.1 CHC2 zinc finger domain-containing protein [Parabacteroides distasonis]